MTIRRIQVATAVATTFFAALLIVQWSISFGRDEAAFRPQNSHDQIPKRSSSSRPDDVEDATLYLLGVGKADITG